MGTTQKISSLETPLAETSLKAWGGPFGLRVDRHRRRHLLPRNVLDLAPLLHPGRPRLHPDHPALNGVGVRPESMGTLQIPAQDLDLHGTPRLPAQRKHVDDFRIGGLKVGGAGSGGQDSRQEKGKNQTTAIPCSLSPESHALASMEHESGRSIPERAPLLNLRGSSTTGVEGKKRTPRRGTKNHKETRRKTEGLRRRAALKCF